MSVLVVALAAVTFVLAGLSMGPRTPTRPPSGTEPPLSPPVAATVRTTGRWRTGGVVLGVVAGGLTAWLGGLGRGLLLAAPLFALCVLAGVIAGELRVPQPQGPVRSAELTVRRVRDHLPRRLATVVGIAGAALFGLLALTASVGSADDLGRAGRSLVRQCSPVLAEGRGPWPGSFYALPLTVVVVSGLVAAALAAVRVVRRPGQGHDPVVETALRRAAATAVTAAAGVLVAVPLASVSVVAAAALLGIGCRPVAWTVLAIALLAVVPAALALAAACAVRLLRPAASQEPTPAREEAGR